MARRVVVSATFGLLLLLILGVAALGEGLPVDKKPSRAAAQEAMPPPPTPTATLTLSIDADPTTPGIQTSRTLSAGTFTVDIVIEDMPEPGLASFEFELVYDQTVIDAPTLGPPLPPIDRNPEANETYLNGVGQDFQCWSSTGDRDTDPTVAKAYKAYIGCFDVSGAQLGVLGDGILASVTFQAIAAGTSTLS